MVGEGKAQRASEFLWQGLGEVCCVQAYELDRGKQSMTANQDLSD